MIIRGELRLDLKNDDYLVVGNGRSSNLSELLNVMLLDSIKVKVKSIYDEKILFDAEGELLKQKVNRNFYLYHVGNKDLDSVLWNLVGRKLEIEVLNVTKS